MERNNGYTHVRRQGQMISPGVTRRSAMPPRETITQNDELIKYIQEAWHMMTANGPVYYKSEDDASRLTGFKPFDIERLVKNMHINHSHQ